MDRNCAEERDTGGTGNGGAISKENCQPNRAKICPSTEIQTKHDFSSPTPNRLYSTSFVKTNAPGVGFPSSGTAVLTDVLKKHVQTVLCPIFARQCETNSQQSLQKQPLINHPFLGHCCMCLLLVVVLFCKDWSQTG